MLPYGGSSTKPPVLFPFSFPIAFPNAVWVLSAYAESNNAGGSNQPEITFMPITPLQKQNNQMAWLTGASGGFPTIAYAPGGTVGLTGIGWVALGYEDESRARKRIFAARQGRRENDDQKRALLSPSHVAPRRVRVFKGSAERMLVKNLVV